MKILFYIGSAFPFGSAWAIRGQNFAKILTELGHNVHIISRFTLEENYRIGENNYFDGVEYEAMATVNSRYSKLYSHIVDLRGIKKYVKENDVDLFFSSSIPMMFKPLKKFLDKKKIPMYIEQCEWFDIEKFKLKQFDPFYHNMMRSINIEFPKSTGIIAISSYLENHYIQKNANVIRIPTILDTESIEFNYDTKLDNKKIKLVFAGNIGGKKELLKPILEAIRLVQKEINIEFNIFGPSKEMILENIDNDIELLEEVSDSIRINGKISQTLVPEQIRNANFMVFLRPIRQSSEAGFPTKLAESLAVGTPVITNLTSDIDLYIKNEVNGFIVNENSTSSLVDVFYKIRQLNDEDYSTIRKNSRQMAEKHFNYKEYKDQVESFIDLKV